MEIMDIEKYIEGMVKEYKTYGDLHNLEYENTQEIAYALEDLLRYKKRYDNLIKRIQEKKKENFENAAKRINETNKNSKVYVKKYVDILLYNTIDDILNKLLEGNIDV